MPKTKIICTIGPATESTPVLKKLITAGMKIARLNFSHGNHQSHLSVINRIHQLNSQLDHPIAILLDTQGPEIRTTENSTGPIQITKGDKIEISYGSKTQSLNKKLHHIGVNYRRMLSDVKVGSNVLLDNGLLQIKIIKKNHKQLLGRALNNAEIGSRKHVNLPGIKVHLPTITAKDKKDIQFGLQNGIDFIAVSFVREAQDIQVVRKLIQKSSAKNARIIAKIEHPSALEHLNEIINQSDGIMIARGDLAIEIPYEEIPIIQRKIVNACIEAGKPVIVATQMLESMVNSPFPTRAEITDVANAVLERSDAIMLSGETTIGKYPVECVQTMRKIAERIETELLSHTLHAREHVSRNQEISRAACLVANNLQARAILVFTQSGKTALNLSNFRPKSQVYAFSHNRDSCRLMNLYWGIHPFLTKNPKKTKKITDQAITILKQKKNLKKGDTIVIVSNILTGFESVDTVQVKYVE